MALGDAAACRKLITDAHAALGRLDVQVNCAGMNRRKPIEQVTEDDFDTIFARIRERGLTYWADPFHSRPGQINHHDGGRGTYFEDPNGHNLEIITRPYGSGAD